MDLLLYIFLILPIVLQVESKKNFFYKPYSFETTLYNFKNKSK